MADRAAPSPAVSAEVTTDRGAIVGKVKAEVREFLGIPYAAAPVGDLRWKPPAAAAPWSTPPRTTRRGHACPQPDTGFLRDTAEDCLTLNVWVPKTPSGPVPVLFWIHSGAFFQGSGGDDFHDGTRLAARARAIVGAFNRVRERLGLPIR